MIFLLRDKTNLLKLQSWRYDWREGGDSQIHISVDMKNPPDAMSDVQPLKTVCQIYIYLSLKSLQNLNWDIFPGGITLCLPKTKKNETMTSIMFSAFFKLNYTMRLLLYTCRLRVTLCM